MLQMLYVSLVFNAKLMNTKIKLKMYGCRLVALTWLTVLDVCGMKQNQHKMSIVPSYVYSQTFDHIFMYNNTYEQSTRYQIYCESFKYAI